MLENIFGTKLNTAVSIDFAEKTLTFYSMSGENRSSINVKSVIMRNNRPDEAFFRFFGEQLAQYSRENPSFQAANIAVILPDNAVVTDTINVPAINRKGMETGFDLAFKTLYSNSDDLKYNKFLAASNKQYGTYFVTMIDKKFFTELNKTCATNKFVASLVTSPANSTVNAVGKLRPKYKRSTYLMVDIKEDYARYIFVNHGRALGSMTLPFGYQILSDKKMVAEDMLFDHSFADLTVINANEKARAKQLTQMVDDGLDPGDVVNADGSITKEDGTIVMPDGTVINPDGTVVPPTETPDEEDDGLVTAEESQSVAAPQAEGGQVKSYQRTARKLPKFMLRPEPTDPRGYVYENFRIFIKWALSFLRSNEPLTTLGEPEFVLVNMPAQYDYLFEVVNRDKAEQKIEFVSFDPAIEDNEHLTANLELFGAFYSKNVNQTNNF